MLEGKRKKIVLWKEVLRKLDARVCNGSSLPSPFHEIQGTPSTIPTSRRSWGEGSLEETLDRLEQPGYQADSFTCASLLRVCGDGKALSNGKLVHAYVVRRELERSKLLENLLVQMYGNCGALEDALELFSRMSQRDEFSWNFMIRAYARYGLCKAALQLFAQMKQEGVKLDKFIFASVLSACAAQATLTNGQQLHACAIGNGFKVDVVIGTALVNMYGKCGSLAEANRTFDNMCERDAVSWNAIISGYAQNEQLWDALALFEQMQREGIRPNRVTFISILPAFARQEALTAGKEMHFLVASSGFECDLAIANALVNMYSKCGSLVDAWGMLKRMPVRNTCSWTAMITAQVQNGQSKGAIKLFDQMQREGILPDKVTYISVLSAFTNDAALAQGFCLHALIMQNGVESDVEVGNALVNMYSRCGSLEDARRFFDKMPKYNMFSWNGMIEAYVQHGHGREAIWLFEKMHGSRLDPDKVTFVSVLSACANELALATGKEVHFCLVCYGYDTDVVMGNALVNMYGKCGYFVDAQRVFDKMLDRDLISWNAMIVIGAQQAQGKGAACLFDQMQAEGVMPDKVTVVCILSVCSSPSSLDYGRQMHARIARSQIVPDVIVGNALVNMYEKCCSIDCAWRIFEIMPERDALSWTAIIAGYTRSGQCETALSLYYQMQQEVIIPDRVTFMCFFSACASQAALAKGKQIHASVVGTVLESDVAVGNTLINMYGKCGNMKDARKCFDKMPICDAISWSSMISIYAHHGNAKDALQLFIEMRHKGVLPDKLTFLSALCACSRAGLIDDGYYWFMSMKHGHGITPTLDHYHCMVDLLGRAGRLDEAEDIIRDLPFEPTVVTWLTLLGACSYQVDVERGERAAKLVFKLEPEDPTPYVTLSNIYATAGRGENALSLVNLI